jgi:glycosyltransferase involved in cell wall biosynthesis
MQPLRIAHVAPMVMRIPPIRSGSVQTMTSLLTEGLVARGHDVTLFAPGNSITSAKLQATFPHGYREDPKMWPWEMYEMLNLSAAVERAREFDVVHYQAEYYPVSVAYARISEAPVSQTLHHAPAAEEVALWKQYPQSHFIAISHEQARLMNGANVAGVVPHGIDTDRFRFRETPDDYLLFLGRFTPGKGPVQAIDVARRTGMRLILAAREEKYYHDAVAPLVDNEQIVYVGEADFDTKVRLYGGARALVYPVQSGEPFGLVLAEAMACGTPVAALNRGAVAELVDDGVSGGVFDSLDALVEGLPDVLRLNRHEIRRRAVERFGVLAMVDGYANAFSSIAARRRSR